MKEMIKVVYKEPNKPYAVMEIPNEYSYYSDLIKADFTGRTLMPGIECVDIVADDSFAINEKRECANFIAPEIETVFCGPVVIMGYDPETGNNTGLDEKQIKYVCDYLAKHQVHDMNLAEAYYVLKVLYSDLQKNHQYEEEL